MSLKRHQFTLLPPAAHLCQECAADHDPALPHKCESLYYQTQFKIKHGRGATWADAMAHCTPEIKKAWALALENKFQIDINSKDIYGNARP